MSALVGGKAANLGELSRLDGVTVPRGFCVTVSAFTQAIAAEPAIARLITDLSRVEGDELTARCARIRLMIEQLTIPDDLAIKVHECLDERSQQSAWAVRSSATAEDLPGASFAGQHDTFLNVIGPAAVLDAIRRCWASMFSDRAVAYRQWQSIDHRSAAMAVLVQEMLSPDVSGVMFTADPLTGERTATTIECLPGLGDALVGGVVTPDRFTVRGGAVTVRSTVADRERLRLSDAQLVALATLGRRIEVHSGSPQDIEWGLRGDTFTILQSRPITTRFPIPERDDDRHDVYLSVGHQQMMTDAMKPLGLSAWQLLAARPMHEAGGRLFVDITDQLAAPASRAGLLKMFNRDPFISDAIETLLKRGFITTQPEPDAATSTPAPTPVWAAGPIDEPEPQIVAELIAHSQKAVAEARQELKSRSGSDVFDYIAEDLAALKQQLVAPESMRALWTGINASSWLNDHLTEWLSEPGITDTLSLSVENNVTSEMGLRLLDVADVIRKHPAVVAHLRQHGSRTRLSDLLAVDGGQHAVDAINDYLHDYGMRCAGEIDITRTRWREHPGTLVPAILANVDRFRPGEAQRRFQTGLERANEAKHDVLQRLRALPDGDEKARQTEAAINRLRAFIGYREYPKYGWVCRTDLHRQAMLKEAQTLADTGVLERPDDIYYLRFDELRQVASTQHADRELIATRRSAHATYERLNPPRVLTSDGEAVVGSSRRHDLPDEALPGIPVSAGIVEGRARIITDIANATLEPGDILVTTYADPSWTPLFLAIAGLVTEAGGAMSHGAVITREYGVPAVVAVEHATHLIQDGERIRVNGTDGYIEILSCTARAGTDLPSDATTPPGLARPTNAHAGGFPHVAHR